MDAVAGSGITMYSSAIAVLVTSSAAVTLNSNCSVASAPVTAFVTSGVAVIGLYSFEYATRYSTLGETIFPSTFIPVTVGLYTA